MGPDPDRGRLNIYALVIYIPGELGSFLDHVRRELVPHYDPHAHVSVLPPRPLAVEWETASAQARAVTDIWVPFEVELTTIEVFPVTDVLYLDVGAGGADLRNMHSAINRDAFAFDEPFVYHPHTTLAQEIEHADVPLFRERANRLWMDYSGPRTFLAEHSVLVQSTISGEWIDLAEYSLGSLAQPVRRVEPGTHR